MSQLEVTWTHYTPSLSSEDSIGCSRFSLGFDPRIYEKRTAPEFVEHVISLHSITLDADGAWYSLKATQVFWKPSWPVKVCLKLYVIIVPCSGEELATPEKSALEWALASDSLKCESYLYMCTQCDSIQRSIIQSTSLDINHDVRVWPIYVPGVARGSSVRFPMQ